MDVRAQKACMRILVVDDNHDMCQIIGDFLLAKDQIVDFAYDGISAMHLALTQPIDIIVLDLMLPGIDGITVCKKLRSEAKLNTPILMITAKDTLDEKLEGFEAGADDYLVKPFKLRELYARIEALYKRASRKFNQVLMVGDLTLDKRTLEVVRTNKKLLLNPICLKILSKLMEESPSIVSKADLETYLWGDNPPDSDSIRSHLYKLRLVIDKPFETPLLHTVNKVGYRIVSNG